MSNIILNHVMVGDKPMVRYLMKQKGGNVEGMTSPNSAMWMLTNDKAKVPHMTQEFPGFPLTADGVYFFDGDVEDGEATSSVTADAVLPAPEGEGPEETEEAAPGCGPDWCEIPEVAEKPKRKRAAKKAEEVNGE